MNKIMIYGLIIFIIILVLYFINYNFNKEWNENFDQRIPIYIINLERSKDRLKLMMDQCDKDGLNCVRLEAIDGKNMDKDKYMYMIKNKNMKDNTIACFLSHMKSLQRFVESGEDYGVVLEDDVYIDKDLISKLKKIKNELENKEIDIDILFLGGTRVCGSVFTDSLLIPKQPNKNCNAGAFGYIVSKNGAEILLKNINRDGIYRMYDHQIRDYFPKMKIFYTNPPLVKHNFEIPSDRQGSKYTKDYVDMSTSVTIV